VACMLGFVGGIGFMLVVDLYKWFMNPQGYKKWKWKRS